MQSVIAEEIYEVNDNKFDIVDKSYEAREYKNTINNKPIVINNQNIDIPHVDNIIDSLLLHKEETKEDVKENYDSLLNDTFSDTQSNISYDKSNNNEEISHVNNYHNVFNSSIMKFESEQESEQESEHEDVSEIKDDEVIEIDRENMDDIKYFQKFSKLT